MISTPLVPPAILSLTQRQVRFESLTAKLVLKCALEDIELICFRFISTQADDLEHYLRGLSEIDPRKQPTMHMMRLAKDYAVVQNGTISWTAVESYLRMGEIAESLGLRWGGRWKTIVDQVHIEYRE
jgi:hypothetical protein